MQNLKSIKKLIKSLINNQGGQTIVEVLVTAGLIGLLFPVLAQGFTLSRGSSVNREARQEALIYMKESLDALRTIRENGWGEIQTNGTYHPEISGNNWTLVSGSEEINGYTRQLVIDDVERDSSWNIVPIGGTVDPSSKKVTHLVSWQDPVPGSIEYITYLTRYLQNAAMQHTTTADFSGGTFVNTETSAIGDGAVILTDPQTSNTFIDEYTTPGDYTYDSAKIEVTGGYAQLKESTVVDSGTTPNSGFDSGTTGWTFYEDSGANPTGSYLATGGNPGGQIRINWPVTKRKTGDAYWEQPFTITGNSVTGTLEFDWRVSTYTGTPDRLEIHAWIDSASDGTPATEVWASGNVTSVTSWSSTVTVDISSYIASPGTYYLKIGGHVDYTTSNTGPYIMNYDNVVVYWGGTEVSYPSDSPDIYPNTSFEALQVNSWDSFSATEILDGGNIGYQLSDDDGTTWYYYEGPPTKAWVSTTSSTTPAADVNSNINIFPTTNNKILVRAFLGGDGTQFVQLDNVTIGYTGLSEENTGTFTSTSMDAGQEVSFNFIEYTDYNTVDTTTQIQIATNSDDSTWNYVGPDGTAVTYYTLGTGQVPISLVSGRYFRYKIYFNSQTEDQPYVEDILVNYSP